MALIIEHGAGGDSDYLAGAIQGLAGFAQGQEAGRRQRLAEEAEERRIRLAEAQQRAQESRLERQLTLAESSAAWDQDESNVGSAAWSAQQQLERQARADALADEDRNNAQITAEARLEQERLQRVATESASESTIAKNNAAIEASKAALAATQNAIDANRDRSAATRSTLKDGVKRVFQEYPLAVELLGDDQLKAYNDIFKGTAKDANGEDFSDDYVLSIFNSLEEELRETEQREKTRLSREGLTATLFRHQQQHEIGVEEVPPGVMPPELIEQYNDRLGFEDETGQMVERPLTLEELNEMSGAIEDWVETETSTQAARIVRDRKVARFRAMVEEKTGLSRQDGGWRSGDDEKDVEKLLLKMQAADPYTEGGKIQTLELQVYKLLDKDPPAGASDDALKRAHDDGARKAAELVYNQGKEEREAMAEQIRKLEEENRELRAQQQ